MVDELDLSISEQLSIFHGRQLIDKHHTYNWSFHGKFKSYQWWIFDCQVWRPEGSYIRVMYTEVIFR